MSPWPSARIEQIAKKVGIGPFGSSIRVETFVSDGVPVISGQHLRGARLYDGEFNYVSDTHAAQLANANVFRGDVVLTHAGNIGQAAYIPDTSRYERYVLSQRQFYIRCHASVMDPSFLTYFFHGPTGRHALLANASQTGVPSIAQPVSYVRTIQVPVPPMSEQRSIVGILVALDDKIDSNKRTLSQIERLSRAAYVHALQHGVCRTPVSEFVEFHNNRRIPLSAPQRAGLPGDYPYYGATGVVDRVGAFIFDSTLCLVGEDGSVINHDGTPVVQYVWGKCWVNNHAHVLTGKGMSTELLVTALQHADVRGRVTGAVQAKLSMGNLRAVEIDLPLEKERAALEESLAGWFARRRAAEEESRTLSALRDALLPELLSGRLRVPEAREQVEAVV